MKTYQKIYLLVSLILYPIVFYAKITDNQLLSQIFVPLLVIWIFVWVLSHQIVFHNRTYWLVTAFAFVCVGDILINLTPYFQASVPAFVVTHICLSVFYIRQTGFKKNQLKLLVIPIVISLLSIIYSRNQFSSLKLQLVFIAYLCVLSFMLWRALSYIGTDFSRNTKLLVIAGSLCFFLTDIFVCMQVLYKSQIFEALTWILYPPALVMLSMVEKKTT